MSQRVLKGRNKFGQYQLTLEDDIIVAAFRGVLNDTLAQKYADDMATLAEDLKSAPWAYVCLAESFDATTQTSQQILIDVYRQCQIRNCKLSVYCMRSALGKAQILQMMQLAGIERDFDKVLFDDADTAKRFAREYLDTLE